MTGLFLSTEKAAQRPAKRVENKCAGLNEVYGVGNFSDFKFRGYDGRLCRFWGIDPLTSKFPWLTPFQFASDNPIQNIDIEGLEGADANIYNRPGVTTVLSQSDAEQVQSSIANTPTHAEQAAQRAQEVARQKTIAEADAAWIEHEQAANWEDLAEGGREQGYNRKFHHEPPPPGFVEPEMDFHDRIKAFFNLTAIGMVAAAPQMAVSNVSKLDATGAVWSQKTFSNTFSEAGKFAGKTIDEVAAGLKSGEIAVKDVPIEMIARGNTNYILNTRSSVALEKAGIPRSTWNTVNRTGNAAAEGRLTTQLQKNNIPNGTNTVRQSGTQTTISN